MIRYDGPTRWDFLCMQFTLAIVLFLVGKHIGAAIDRNTAAIQEQTKVKAKPIVSRPVIAILPQDRKPILPVAAPLPDADIELLIAELQKQGLSAKDAATMRRLTGGGK